jgi:hypothetical protein
MILGINATKSAIITWLRRNAARGSAFAIQPS